MQFNVFPLDRYAATRETLGKRFFRSTTDGELKIASIGRGRYLIVANDPAWMSMPVLVDTTIGDKKDVEIRVSKGTPVAVRLRADPLPAARLEVRTRSGLPVAERRCRDRDPVKFMLVPGSYSIELWVRRDVARVRDARRGRRAGADLLPALRAGPGQKRCTASLRWSCSTSASGSTSTSSGSKSQRITTSCDSPAPSVIDVRASS